jgi:sulfur carrier protein
VNVTVNGEPRELGAGATVATVVEMLDVAPSGRGVAVALDGEVVSRGRWADTRLSEGSTVEVLAAIGGG